MEAYQIAEAPTRTMDWHELIRNGDKLQLFRTKYEDQKDYNFGHWVVNAGGAVATFDINKQKWLSEEFHDLKPILNENEEGKLDEQIFVFVNTIFMLLYNRFEGLRMNSLWKFDEHELKWIKHSNLDKVIEPANNDEQFFASRMITVKTDSTADSVYFVAKPVSKDGTVFDVIKLQIDDNSSKCEIIHRIDDINTLIPSIDNIPVTAVLVGEHIFTTVAEHGCGYRWRTDDVLKFNLNTKKTSVVKIVSGNPKFRMLMPTLHYYDTETDSWLFFGSLSTASSSQQRQTTNKQPETQFYALSALNSDQPCWQQSDQVLDSPISDDVYEMCAEERSVFVVSRGHGVLKLPYGNYSKIGKDDED